MSVNDTKLRDQFPMLLTREGVLEAIQRNPSVLEKYNSWSAPRQEMFLDFTAAVKGLKPLYDSFFKELFNVESTPERLEELLSLLLERKVRIQSVLPNDNSRIAAENTLLVTDIVVQMENGSLANVEVQKRGYDFPGQRSACYSSDLLLRQYKRVRSEKRERFSYRDIRDVYCIVLFENSPKDFAAFPETYIHRSQQKMDSGLELDLLQKYIFIPLDIFAQIYHNKGIRNKQEAWLAFLSQDDPKDVLRLIEQYPEFKPLYEQLYQICRNVEAVMGIFSDELRMLDENTVQYMMDEQQKKLEELTQKTEEMSKRADEATQRADEATQRADEANLRADEANLRADEATQKAEETEKKMDSLRASVLHAIREGQISFSHGVEILNLPDEESLKRLLAETEG